MTTTETQKEASRILGNMARMAGYHGTTQDEDNGCPDCKVWMAQKDWFLKSHNLNGDLRIKAEEELAALKAAPVAPAQPVKLDDIEQYRMQMAGISTAALGYWKESDTICPDYDTLALRDVAKLYAKYDELYKAAQPTLEKLREYVLKHAPDYPGIEKAEPWEQLYALVTTLEGVKAANEDLHKLLAQPLTKESVQLKKGECWPEDVMQQWDYWRKEIANGFTGSAPRDWFESLSELRMVDFNDRQRLTKEQVEKVLQALWLGFDASLSQARVSIFNEAIEIMKGVRG